MKKYSLSGSKQKIICLILISFFIILNIFNFYILKISNTPKYLFLILSVIISFLYGYVIFSSILIINKDDHSVTVKLLRKETYDLRKVNDIKVEDCKVQEKTVKTIVLYDSNKKFIGRINTFFTAKQNELTEKIVRDLNALS